MFSSTTIALSTTIPTAKLIPARLMTLMLRPMADMTRKVPTILTGIATAMMPTALKLRKNKKSTATARMPPTMMF